MQNDAKDAARWRFVRDVLWANAKRGDLPELMRDCLGLSGLDIKYPNATDLDRVVDALVWAQASPEDVR
jgi:hypothetical protein